MAPIRTDSAFVGRARELSRLEQVLEHAIAGSAAGVLVAGDAGVGKTRLTRELVRRAEAQGVVTAVGHCVDLGAGGLPYLPFAEALGSVARAAGGGPGAQTWAAAGEALRAVVAERPVLMRLTGRVQGDPDDDALERLPLYEAVLEALRAVTDVAPVLLVLEDLHWADASTRDLLRFLLSRLSDDRLLVVGTYRTDDLHRRHPLRPLLAELVRLPRVERLDVAPFDPAELREYLRVLHGRAVPESVAEGIRRRSEGNAYYAEELLAAVDGVDGDVGGHGRGDDSWTDGADRAAQPADDGATSAARAGAVALRGAGLPPQRGPVLPEGLPEGLAEVLLARLERLPPAVQHLARVASVAGRRVSDSLLRAAAAMPPAEAEEALREAVAHHVLVPDPTDPRGERYAFRHALLQEAVYADLLPGERVRLHGEYARLLAADGDGAVAADLERHYLAAHDLPGALRAAVRAGEEAGSCLAPAESLEHYEQALQLWPAVASEERPDGVELPALLLRAAASAGAAGELHRAAALAAEAVREASATEDAAGQAAARVRLAEHLYDAEDPRGAVREAEAVRHLLEGTGPSPTRLWAAAIEARVAAYDGDLDAVRRIVEPAVAEARDIGLPAAEADLLVSLALRESREGEVDTATDQLLRAERLAREGGSPVIALRAVFNLGINQVDEGDLAAARRTLERGLADAERAGVALSMYGTESLLVLVTALTLAGDWDEALALEARESPRLPRWQRGFLRLRLLDVLVARDPLGTLPAMRELDPLIDEYPSGNHVLLAPQADALRWLGDPEGAVAVVRRSIDVHTAAGWPHDLGLLRPLAIGLGALGDLARDAVLRDDAAALARARAEGAELLARLRDVADRGLPRLRSTGPEGRAWVARGEAEATRLDGPGDVPAWRAAVDAFGFGHRYEVARSRWRLAEALAAGRAGRGTTGRDAADVAEAARCARAARDEALALGARPLREAVDALARRARLDLGGGAASAGVLTPREQEVMRLVAQGLTNRQIGRRLFISEKTASVHVSNVLAKLDAGGRAEAVAIAARRGLLTEPERS